MRSKAIFVSVLMLLTMMSASVFAEGGIARTPWEMNRGRDYISLPSSLNNHGEIAAYDSASIPPVDDPDWEDAPSAISIGFSETSIIPDGLCWVTVDYTYFQTMVDVPVGTTVSTFSIEFSGIDDGGRVTIFNATYPEGLVIPGSYVYLGDTSTTNLATYVTEGVNRVVVTQVDDCPDGNNLQSATVVLNGDDVAVPATEQTFTVYGANGTPGDQDPYIQALPEGATTWSQAYLTGTHIWGLVPGTNSWLNFDPDPEVGINTSTPYRIRFMVPEDFTDPSMTFQVKADNLGIIWINDTYIDSVVGEGTPDVPDATIEQALHVGMNEIRITMVDWGGVVGLNYRIDVTMTSAENLSNAVLTPEDAAELNNEPIADAGNDFQSNSNMVTLDASGSSDPDGNILFFEWFLNESEEPFATGVNPTVELPNGHYGIGLRVSDGESSDWDWIEVLVNGEGVEPNLAVRMIPRFGSEVVGPGQGRVIYDVHVQNYDYAPARFTLRIYAQSMTTDRLYGPLADTPVQIWLDPEGRLDVRIGQYVPAWIPAGDYLFTTEIGNYSYGVIDADGFMMTRQVDVAAASGDEGSAAEWTAIYYDMNAEVMQNDIWTSEGVTREDGSNVLSTLSVGDDLKPTKYNLSQNFPNPFNPSTTISFDLKSAGEVSLKVYNINGVEVEQVASGHYNAGHYTVNFSSDNLSSGTYFYVLETGSFRDVKRMVLLK